jgi:hypothetical protein
MHPERYSRLYESFLLVALILVVVASQVTAPADASTAHHHKPKPHKIHCKANQRIRRKVIKLKGKRTTKLVCVKKAVGKKTATTPTAPPATEPEAGPKSSRRIPHSHLDPSFEQSPLNPFSTTWHYSASATEEVTDAKGVVESFAAPLPEGTLSFFVNGSLECAVNVGPGNEESACDVMLKALGPQKVTTTYSSGSLSSTETEIDNVEPVQATTALSYTYEQWTTGEATSKGEQVGTLNLHLAVTPTLAAEDTGWSNRFPTCRSEELPACVPVPQMKFGIIQPLFDAEGNAAVPVYMRENAGEAEVLIDAIPPGSSTSEVTWHPLSEIEDGSHYLRYESHYVAGYSGNGTVEILGGRIEATYTTKTTLAFAPDLVE